MQTSIAKVSKTSETKVDLFNVRALYANHLVTPREERKAKDGNIIAPAYETTLLIPDEDVETIRVIEQACIAAFQKKLNLSADEAAKKHTRLSQFSPQHVALRPGASREGDVYQGHRFIPAKANIQYPPKLLSKYSGPDGKPMIIERNIPALTTCFYSGCYLNVQLNFYAYTNTKEGIGCDILVAQFAADGEAFSAVVQADTSGFTGEPMQPDEATGFGL